MPHIKVVFLWPYARVRGVHPAYARAYAYAYHLCICIPPTQLVAYLKMISHLVLYLRNYQSINVFLKIMPHIKSRFSMAVCTCGGGVHPVYARAYAYAYNLCICIPPTQGLGPTSLGDDVDLCWDDSDDGDVWENSIAHVRRRRTRGRTGRARVVGSIMAYAVVYH